MSNTGTLPNSKIVFLSFAIFASAFLSPVVAETNEATPLEVAVREYNEGSKDKLDSNHKLTVDEVMTAFANWQPAKLVDPSSSEVKETSAIFNKVASTRQLPPGSMFHTSIDWTKSEDGLTEVKSTDLCLGIRTGVNRLDSLVIHTERGASRPAAAEGFEWNLAPAYPTTSFTNNGFSFSVARDSELRVTAIFCALSSKHYHKDARLVAFDQHGQRLAAHGIGGEFFDGISMKMYQFPNVKEEVSLIGVEEPIAE